MSSLEIGAREKLMFEIGNNLTHKGNKVQFVFIGANEGLLKNICLSSKRVNLLSWSARVPLLKKINKLKLLLGIWGLRRFLQQEKPDLLLAVSIPPSLTALVAKIISRSNTKIIVRQSNVIRVNSHPEYSTVKKRLRDFIVPFLYMKAHGFIAVSKGVKTNLEILLRKNLNIKVIYNKVLNREWFLAPSKMPDHPWFRDQNLIIFLAVGRLVQKKDYPTMIRSFKLAANQNKSVRLLILGEGPERKKIQHLINRVGMRSKIELLGRIQDPHPYYYYSYGFLLSSISEGMPSSVIEAMGTGCQIISTDCPSGPSEILLKGKYGKITHMKDHKKMASCILESLDEKISEAKILERAKEFSAEKGIEEYTCAILEFCKA